MVSRRERERSALVNRVGLFAVFIACLPSVALTQEQSRTVTGTVVDAANRPVSGVRIRGRRVWLNHDRCSRSFPPGGSPPGHTSVELPQERLRAAHVQTDTRTKRCDRRNIGVISLEAGPDLTTTLTGRVLEGGSGQPVEGAGVELNGNVVAVSGGDGHFRAYWNLKRASSSRIEGGRSHSTRTIPTWWRPASARTTRSRR